ncbi:hypothetical protein F5B19DRAFT_493505 [Rostrohypoxylon terebratum]|nr:hypothetical protein F5B19DRAFT_493505 [Rostrohypoxylon terebratum]
MPYDEVNTQGERQIMRTEKVVDYHAPLRELLCGDATFSLLKQLTGKDKINHKLAAGSGFVAHIDAPSYTHMGATQFIEIMVAVEPQTKENGWLEIVPGSHKQHVDLSNGGRVANEWESSNEFVPLLLSPGMKRRESFHVASDKVTRRYAHLRARLSSPLRSNMTKKRRAAVFGTYHFQLNQPDLREKYYAHRRVHFPPDHEREKGEAYKEGWTMFAYSSPFTKPKVTV